MKLQSLFICIIIAIALLWCNKSFSQAPSLKAFNVVWDSPSINSSGSMPMGNGDIGANVWVEKTGYLHILISKTDAFSDIGRLLKIGKIIVKIDTNLFSPTSFSQTLDIEAGIIHIKSQKGNNTLQLDCWIDANQPIIHVEGSSNIAANIEVENIVWRTKPSLLVGSERHSAYGVGFRDQPFQKETDTLLREHNKLIWCHQNKESIWALTLINQSLNVLTQTQKDPLLYQTFGAVVEGKNLKTTTDRKLMSISPTKQMDIKILIHKQQVKDLAVWKQHALQTLSRAKNTLQSKALHKQWWAAFWNKHYLMISCKEEQEAVFNINRGYILQRYINACAGRGSLPIKFNGSIFTVDVKKPDDATQQLFDEDYRLWGANYWFQNTRLPYNSMYFSGDTSMIMPFFNLYLNALPLATYRTQQYYHHKGAFFPEVITPWGTYLNDNYGWDRVGKPLGVSDNKYIRYYWQNGIELSCMMLEYIHFTQNRRLLETKFIPFIQQIIDFFDNHYPRETNGTIRFEPAQALETYQEGVINPTPEIAGLQYLIQELRKVLSAKQHQNLLVQINRLAHQLPEIPTQMSNNHLIIAAGSHLGEIKNIEKPALYAVFPYRLYSQFKPNAPIAIETYHQRINKETFGWQQDGIFAALLGLTDEAKKIVTVNFATKDKNSRFPAFWGPNYDWVPDQDHGTVNMRILQNMFIQVEGDNVHLLASWPKNWNLQFKVSAPKLNTIEGTYDSKTGIHLTKKQYHGIKVITAISNQ